MGFVEEISLFLDACPGPPLARTGLRIAALQAVEGIPELQIQHTHDVDKRIGLNTDNENWSGGRQVPYLSSVGRRGQEAEVSSRLSVKSIDPTRLLLLSGAPLDSTTPRTGTPGRGNPRRHCCPPTWVRRCRRVEQIHTQTRWTESESVAGHAIGTLGPQGHRRCLFWDSGEHSVETEVTMGLKRQQKGPNRHGAGAWWASSCLGSAEDPPGYKRPKGRE